MTSRKAGFDKSNPYRSAPKVRYVHYSSEPKCLKCLKSKILSINISTTLADFRHFYQDTKEDISYKGNYKITQFINYSLIILTPDSNFY